MVIAATRRAEGTALQLQVAEQRFSQLADQVPVGIVSSRSGLRADFANSRCADLLGSTPEDLFGTGWVDRLDRGNQEEVLDSIEQVMVNGSEVLLRVSSAGEQPRAG